MITRCPSGKMCNCQAIVKNVTLNNNTATVLLSANPNRNFVNISNTEQALGVWIKLKPASDDNDKDGIYLDGDASWQMDTVSVYTGEISAIAQTDSPTISITEY